MKRNEIVTLIGGSGFIGSNIVKEIASTGVRIKVVSRNASSCGELRVCGYVGQIALVDADITNEKDLEKVIKGSDYVINLIGILFEKGKRTFEKMHVELAEKVAMFCTKHKVKKLIHFSALGCDKALTSKYAQTKLKGEEVVKSNYKDVTVLRPSVVFGAGDNFTNLINWMSKISPILPLIGGGHTVFQPIYVGDLATIIAMVLKDSSKKHIGKTYELGGPTKISFKDVMHEVLKVSKKKRILLPVPLFIANVKAFFLEFMPQPLLTRDQIELLKYDNVTKKNATLSFISHPAELDVMLNNYIR